MARTLPFLAAVGCSADADLTVRLSEDAFTVGEAVEVTIGGTVDAPSAAAVELSVFTDVPEDALENVTFTWVKSVPTGDASLVTDRSGANESPIAMVRLFTSSDRVSATFQMACLAPASGELLGNWSIDSKNGTPLAGGITAGAAFACE